ncbi:MAG: hypothetical protein WDM80_10495 [Limisphaerales bacterium]
MTWTPISRLCFQGGFNYVLSTTQTPTSAYTQAILNSQNNYWTITLNSMLVLDDKTDFNVDFFIIMRVISTTMPLTACRSVPVRRNTP